MTTTPTAVTGANVRAEMARRGMSQATIGKLLGISQASVSSRLRGTTPFNINELVAIAAYLDVPLAVLTDGIAA
jgi:predicted transcriptional regulator